MLAFGPEYTRKALIADLIAGVTVGLVALPLAMAFAISSGLSPQAGIYCAIVTGFIISALGGSRYQIGGPTGAFVVVVSGIVAEYGVDGLFMCTMMAGVMLVVMGLTGTGTAVKFIPRPVVIGFTNGIALLIASTQIKDFLGLTIDVPGEFIDRIEAIGFHLSSVSMPTLALGAGTLAVLVGWNRVRDARARLHRGALRRHRRRGGARAGRGHDRVALRRHPVGPAGVSRAHVPPATWCSTLLSPAVTVAMLGAIESLLSAVVADRMSGDRHNPNVELVAQGVANIVVAAVRRAAGHRRDRAHRHQHPRRARTRPCRASSTP